MPSIANLSMFQGEDKTFQDLIYQADGVTPQDITGWTVRFVICSYNDPTTIFLAKACTAVGPTANGLTGVTVLSTDTAPFYPGQYSYFFERTDVGADAVPTLGLFTLMLK